MGYFVGGKWAVRAKSSCAQFICGCLLELAIDLGLAFHFAAAFQKKNWPTPADGFGTSNSPSANASWGLAATHLQMGISSSSS